MSLKHVLVAVMLAFGANEADAQEALPLSGTFAIDIYNGFGGGTAGSPGVQALANNPLIEGAPLASITYTGPLDFSVSGESNTIGAFLASGSGSYSPPLPEGVAATVLSSPAFATTTVFDITFTEGAISDGNLSHDDGVGLYVNDLLLTPSAVAPTERVDTPFTSLAGQYRLIYVATNGNPSILGVTGTPVSTPDFVDFGCRIDLAQTDVAPAFRFTLPASSSEKFCPESNGGMLKLGCSGTIPDYGPEGPVITSTQPGVVCRISGSQCGFDQVFTADVSSISISSNGSAQLTCEANVAVPG